MAIYRVSIKKSFGASGGKGSWVNNYILDTTLLLFNEDMKTLVLHIANFEKGFSNNAVQFLTANVTALDAGVIGNINAKNNRTIPIGGTGAGILPGGVENGVLMREEVAYVRFGTTYGNNGSKSYRGVLIEADVIHNSGNAIMSQAFVMLSTTSAISCSKTLE